MPDCDGDSRARTYSPSLLERTATYQAVSYFSDEFADNSASVNPMTHFLIEGAPPVDKSSITTSSATHVVGQPNVRSNLAAGVMMFEDASRALADKSIELAVLIIPSKERVIQAWAAQREAPRDDEFDSIVASEQRLTTEFTSFFSDAGIAYIDALPDVVAALDAALKEGERFYRLNDGHPYAAGYAAYAKSAERLLVKLAATDPQRESNAPPL